MKRYRVRGLWLYEHTRAILWNSMTLTSFVFTELADTIKYGGGVLYNLVFTEWRPALCRVVMAQHGAIRWPYVDPMLLYRLRRWPNIGSIRANVFCLQVDFTLPVSPSGSDISYPGLKAVLNPLIGWELLTWWYLRQTLDLSHLVKPVPWGWGVL